ncbi:hypothetical protein ACHAC9_22940 [Massilia sp. CMS3.1]|uniref:hypothetical protein n=1 Tax=Massilia sp. CMS3.1 TaxID=3373083 RepID=UPI003EE75770
MTQVQNDKDDESVAGNYIHRLLWAAMGVAGAVAMAAQASLEMSALGSPASGGMLEPVAAFPAPVAPGADAVRLREAFITQKRGGVPRDRYGPNAALASTIKEIQ